MRLLFFLMSITFLSLTSCKKDDSNQIKAPTVLGDWEIIKTETTHELGHYGPYDPPVRDISSRITTIVDHQDVFSTVEVSATSVRWTNVDAPAKIYNWEYENNLFSLTDTDTTLVYHVNELTTDSFVFFIKDFRTYNDSSNLVAYEEYQYVYHLIK